MSYVIIVVDDAYWLMVNMVTINTALWLNAGREVNVRPRLLYVICLLYLLYFVSMILYILCVYLVYM